MLDKGCKMHECWCKKHHGRVPSDRSLGCRKIIMVADRVHPFLGITVLYKFVLQFIEKSQNNSITQLPSHFNQIILL